MNKSFKMIFVALAILTLSFLFVGCNSQHTHEFNEMVSTDTFLNTPATCTQKATYFYSCACGEKGTETFESGEMAQHNFNKQVATQDFFVAPASCTAKETYNYSCQCLPSPAGVGLIAVTRTSFPFGASDSFNKL